MKEVKKHIRISIATIASVYRTLNRNETDLGTSESF
jgi:hypothetical protein